MQKQHRQQIIEEIITFELDIFQRVKTAEPSACQENMDTFKLMRRMTHSVLSIDTLKSYLADLKKAIEENRNLCTEKYARMDNLIPPLKYNPIIDRIAEIETSMMKDFSKNHPNLFGEGIANFKNYLRSELETYSDNTLSLYLKDIINSQEQKRNLAEERYKALSLI